MDMSSILFLIYVHFISLNSKKVREKEVVVERQFFTVNCPTKGEHPYLYGDNGVGKGGS